MARPPKICMICADPNRYAVEQRYLEDGSGVRDLPYTRQEIEAHMSHVADPRALAMVTDLTNASAVAGRLRALETTAVKIMDLALAPQYVEQPDGSRIVMPPDPKVALAALREARATIVEMGRLTQTLESQHDEAEERPDLDAAIGDYLRGKDIPVADPPSAAPTAPHDESFPRALPPGE